DFFKIAITPSAPKSMEQDHEIDPPKTTTLLKSLSATNLSKRLKISPLGHSLTEI
ncbi:6571_t:CDS:1, partial [Acaulospora colombiana]